jgi:hypothetical protein
MTRACEAEELDEMKMKSSRLGETDFAMTIGRGALACLGVTCGRE